MSITFFKKFILKVLVSMLSIISTTCFILHPTHIYVILIARIFGGISNGIVHLAVLMHSCEVSDIKIRRFKITLVNLSITIGVLITSCNLLEVYKTRSYEIDPTKMMGCNGLLCILISMFLVIFLNNESPICLIKTFQQEQVFEKSYKLETLQIGHEFNEQNPPKNENSNRNFLYQILIAVLLKTNLVCSFNMPLNLYLLEVSKFAFYDGINDMTGICLLSFRLAAILISMFFVNFGNTKFFLFSSIGSSLMLVLQTILELNESLYPVILSLLFNFFAGFAFESISYGYIIKLASKKVRASYVCFLIGYEVLLQMIFVVIYFYSKMSTLNLVTVLGIIPMVFDFSILLFSFCFKFEILTNIKECLFKLMINKLERRNV